MRLQRVLLVCAALAAFAIAVSSASSLAQSRTPARTAEGDRRALIALENEWLAHERDSATLERILAPDFVHAVAPGRFLTKEQHISWSAQHPLPANHSAHFEKLRVRLYGDVGIASGIVASGDGDKNDSRSLFTDVFAFRNGRWRAVHAQETSIASSPGP